MKNEGIQEFFYIPLTHYDEWNKALYNANLYRFRFRSTGVPLGMAKTEEHKFIEERLSKDE